MADNPAGKIENFCDGEHMAKKVQAGGPDQTKKQANNSREASVARKKILNLLWIVLLVAGAFTLGYYLNPHKPKPPSAPFGIQRPAPPLRFNP